EMSESEFEAWLEARARFAEMFPKFQQESRISQIPPPREEFPYKPVLAISLPDREELFVSRYVKVDLGSASFDEFLKGVHYFPESVMFHCTWPGRRQGN